MPANVTTAIVFIVNAITSLYLLVLLLRFWMPLLGADFRNPLAQGILRLTSPLVIPLRRILPAVGRIDTATVLVAFVIQYVTLLVLLLIIGQKAGGDARAEIGPPLGPGVAVEALGFQPYLVIVQDLIGKAGLEATWEETAQEAGDDD